MSPDKLYNLSMIFEKTTDWHFPEVTVTHRMIRILSMINGKHSLAEIYEKLDLTYEALFGDLQYLHDLRLIKTADPANPEQSGKAPSGLKKKKGYYRGASFNINE